MSIANVKIIFRHPNCLVCATRWGWCNFPSILVTVYSVSIYPLMQACVSYLSAMILLFLDPQFNGYAFTSGLQITVNSIHRQKHLGICLPTVGSQTWVRSGWEFFRPSGESNPRPWRWIKSARDQHVKCNERRTRPCHRAYYIRGSTPFHSCVEVRSPKLVSSKDRTGPGPHPLPTALPRE